MADMVAKDEREYVELAVKLAGMRAIVRGETAHRVVARVYSMISSRFGRSKISCRWTPAPESQEALAMATVENVMAACTASPAGSFRPSQQDRLERAEADQDFSCGRCNPWSDSQDLAVNGRMSAIRCRSSGISLRRHPLTPSG